MLAGGLFTYRVHTQPITAQNACEAELIAANACAKVAKYVHMVMTDLGCAPAEPSPIWEDNGAAVKIVNQNRPTQRSRHIAIKYFGLQQWRQLGKISIAHVRGIINPADALTKALGWVPTFSLVLFTLRNIGTHAFMKLWSYK